MFINKLILPFMILFIGGIFFCVSIIDEHESSLQNNKIFETRDHYYRLGLVRGCDIGCIDYDLRINNQTWKSENYNVSESKNYNECSNHCIESFGFKKMN